MATEKMKSHALTPVDPCGFSASCPSEGLLLIPMAVVAIILAVVVTATWIVGRRVIRQRRKPSTLG